MNTSEPRRGWPTPPPAVTSPATGPAHPVVRSKEVAEKFGVTSFPTLLVVGPDGVVRGIFSGSYPTQQEDLIACVEQVLAADK